MTRPQARPLATRANWPAFVERTRLIGGRSLSPLRVPLRVLEGNEVD